VYGLRIDDGELVWRFCAAPEDRLVGAFDRLESAWPVHGSVVIQNDRAYVVAGRSSFLDGGLEAWCLDPLTGRVLQEERIADEQSVAVDTGRKHTGDYGVLADVLTADGEGIYLRQRRLFSPEKSQPFWGNRLGATAGMLDGSWFNRTYWVLDGRVHGETLVHNKEFVYAVRAYDNRGHGGFVEAGHARNKLVATRREPVKETQKQNDNWAKPGTSTWVRTVSPRIRAMAVAGQTLVCVGTPDVIEAEDPWAAYEGRRGGLLMLISAVDGTMLSEMSFDGGPVQDGIAIADARLYITTNDGRLYCYK
jgi:hypothetical protein